MKICKCGKEIVGVRINKNYCSEYCMHKFSQQKYRRSNVIKLRLRDSEYKKKNVAPYRYVRIKNRCKVKKISLMISKDEFINWYNNEIKICHYCKISPEIMSILHMQKNTLEVDRKHGGAYNLDNICLSCHYCNRVKNNILFYEVMIHLGKIQNRIWRRNLQLFNQDGLVLTGIPLDFNHTIHKGFFNI